MQQMKKIMKIDDRIKSEKIQYHFDEESAKISAFSFGYIDKYECLGYEEILLPKESRIIEEKRFIYFPLRPVFIKQTKAVNEQGKRQVEALLYLNVCK